MEIIENNLKFKSMTWGNKPNKIILHNADASNCSVEDIHQWHLNNGWSGIGYHFFIKKNGQVYRGRPIEAVGSHCQGSNTNSIGICFEGRYMTEIMPQEQRNSGVKLIQFLRNMYGDLPVYGHKELFNTDCPGANFPLDYFKGKLNNATTPSTKGEWIKQDNKWWYKHSDGSYTKQDWEFIDGNWYYFDVNGYMSTGWIYISKDDKYYYCYDDGKMAHDVTLWGTWSFDSNGVGTKLGE